MGTFNASTTKTVNRVRFRKFETAAVSNEVVYTPSADVEYAEVRIRNFNYNFIPGTVTTHTLDIQPADPDTQTYSTTTSIELFSFTSSISTVSESYKYLAGRPDGATQFDDKETHLLFPGERITYSQTGDLATNESVSFYIMITEYKIIAD